MPLGSPPHAASLHHPQQGFELRRTSPSPKDLGEILRGVPQPPTSLQREPSPNAGDAQMLGFVCLIREAEACEICNPTGEHPRAGR